MSADNSDEVFPPTGGRIFGALTVAVGVGLAVVELVDGGGVTWAAVAFGVLVAAIGWCVLLRPRVGIEGEHLVLRNMVDTVRVPLAGVEEVVVRQFLAVRAGEKRYTSSAVGRSRRALAKEGLRGVEAGGGGDVVQEGQVFAVFVEQRIRDRAEQARKRLGIRVGSAEQDALAAEQTRRVPALPELVWLGGSALAWVLLLVL